jgi:hypothetical protein
MYFLFTYEYGTLKPVEVILRRGEEEEGGYGRNELNRGTFLAYLKYHNKTPCTAIIY